MSTSQTTPFGSALRHWRRLRGVSQLDLASAAATTTRHLSYLETGRSRPSREMVQRLADALVIPLRERNRLLEQAGLPSSYPEGELAADDLAAFRSVLDRLLSTHEPYPAFVVDRHWNLVAANTATQHVFPHQPGTNTVRLLIDSLSPLIENWVDVAPAFNISASPSPADLAPNDEGPDEHASPCATRSTTTGARPVLRVGYRRPLRCASQVAFTPHSHVAGHIARGSSARAALA